MANQKLITDFERISSSPVLGPLIAFPNIFQILPSLSLKINSELLGTRLKFKLVCSPLRINELIKFSLPIWF